MALTKQLVPIQFGGGVNTKVDPKQLQAGQFLSLQNAQLTKTGQLNKRFGYTTLNTSIEGGGSITNGIELAAYKNELILFDGNNIYSYITATGSWANRGTAISVTTQDKDIIRTSSAQQLNPDMNYVNGIEAYAWEDSRGGVYYSVLDTATQAFVVSSGSIEISLLTTTVQPKVIAFQNYLVVLCCYTTGLYYSLINPYNPSLIQAPIAIATDGLSGVNGFPYDACVYNNSLYITYLNNQNNIISFYLDAGFGKQQLLILEQMYPNNYSVHGALSIAPDASGDLWIVYADGNTVNAVEILTPLSTPVISGPFPIDICNATTVTSCQSPTANQQLIFYEVYNSTGYNEQVRYCTVLSNVGTISSSSTIRSVGLASKPFTFNNNIYINTAYQSTLQSTDFTFVISVNNTLLTTPTIIAKETPSVGGGLQTNGMLPEVISISSGVFKFANLIAGSIISAADTLFTLLGVNSTELLFTPTDNFVNTVQDNTLLIVGGILQGYDSVSTTELGFHLYPENVIAASGGSGSLSTGTYQYCAVFAWTDNWGQVYRSAPSVPISVNVTAGQQVLLSGPSLRLTSKTMPISIEIYRTAANGTTFNQVTDTLSPLLNSTTADTWNFTDSLSDFSAQSNALLYTTGNVLANIAPPANSIIATYGDRVFLAGMSDKLLMWYSQTVVGNDNANTIPPQFCAELTFSIDPRGGNITGLGLLNNVLIIFKENNIFALQGNGPDATGNNSDYGDAQLITSDVGCIADNSIVIVPNGLMFQSAKGIYLLDQSLNLTYIGAPVEAYNSATITSATLNYNENQVIFTTNQAGTALVYDYYQQQWYTWTNHYAADATIFDNSFVYLTTNGTVYMQNQSIFTDNGAPVYMSFVMPNLAFAGIQGYQRVFRCYILGSFKSAHNLIVNVAYDYNDNYSQSTTIMPSTTVSTWGSDSNWGSGMYWGGNAYTIYEFRVDFAIQKCTAIRLQISDSLVSAEGYAISSIIFEVGTMPGGNRLPTTATYGTQ